MRNLMLQRSDLNSARSGSRACGALELWQSLVTSLFLKSSHSYERKRGIAYLSLSGCVRLVSGIPFLTLKEKPLSI